MIGSKPILIGLTSLSIVLSVVLLIRSRGGEADNGAAAAATAWEEKTVESLFGVISSNYKNSNLPYPYVTEDMDGNKVDIRKVAGTGRRLVLRYSELSCNVCVDSALMHFNAFAQKVGEDKVVLLVEYRSVDYLAQLIRLNHLQSRTIYRIIRRDTTKTPAEDVEEPFLFILDGGGQMKDVFYPLRELPTLSELYYDAMYEKYFNHS